MKNLTKKKVIKLMGLGLSIAVAIPLLVYLEHEREFYEC